jgi:flotillin
MGTAMKNEYLEQVKQQQQQLEVDLRAKRSARLDDLAGMGMAGPPASTSQAAAGRSSARAWEPDRNPPAVEVRITGFWRWKTVIVPPNAYVVHTRRGRAVPLHLGLGVSFRFDPYLDSFLVVPAAMQTILINANCICRELQGLVVQGYVQWIIGDFGTAYRKLDFTDLTDPMRVVNLQLREQAEAAIKDKVATMGIDEVLSDKQPIIQELTARLREVAEGGGEAADRGLGLRIVTVQVKEAVVCSPNLWENLQRPFRAERERVARLAALAAQSAIEARELEHEKTRQTAQLASQAELALLRASEEAQAFDREQKEKARRSQTEEEVARRMATAQHETQRLEQEAARVLEEASIDHARRLAEARQEAQHRELLKGYELELAENDHKQKAARAAAAVEKAKLESEAELLRLRAEDEQKRAITALAAHLERETQRLAAQNKQSEVELGFEATRHKLRNDLSAARLQADLIGRLPEIARELPKPAELRAITIGDGSSREAQALGSLVAQVMGVLEAFRRPQAKVSSNAERPAGEP